MAALAKNKSSNTPNCPQNTKKASWRPHFKTELRHSTSLLLRHQRLIVASILTQTITRLPALMESLNYSPPKPPKKRYLENLANEACKTTNNATPYVISNPSTSFGQSASNNVINCTNAGPPILDIETDDRVIEYAWSGSLSSDTPSNTWDTPREMSVFNSHVIYGQIDSVTEQHSMYSKEVEEFERNSDYKTGSDVTNIFSNANQITYETRSHRRSSRKRKTWRTTIRRNKEIHWICL